MGNEDKAQTETNGVSLSGVVDKVRVIARDGLRLQNIANLKSDLLQLNLTKEESEKYIKSLDKEIARSEYQLKKVDEENPDAEVIKENRTNEIADYKQRQENVKKDIAKIDEQIADVNARIVKWENGESKVQMSNLDEETKRLLSIYTSEQAREI